MSKLKLIPFRSINGLTLTQIKQTGFGNGLGSVANTQFAEDVMEMKVLMAREAQVWQQVDTLLDTWRKIASVYDKATALLENLKQLADFQYTRRFLLLISSAIVAEVRTFLQYPHILKNTL